jgi:hypothetical protein
MQKMAGTKRERKKKRGQPSTGLEPVTPRSRLKIRDKSLVLYRLS